MPPLRLALEYFVPWTNDVGYQLAIAEGYYADAGIEVRQVLADPLHGDALEHLAGGEVELAVCPTNRLWVRHEAGQRLLGVAAINHAQMETILTVRATGITRPAELAGRRLGLNCTPRGLAMVRTLVEADGGDFGAVELIDTAAREVNADVIADGELDAFFGAYWAWDALFGTTPETERVVWALGDLPGAPNYHSYLVGVQEAFAEREPETVSAFLAATEQGFRVAMSEPDRALAVLRRTIPYVHPRLLTRTLEVLPPSWFHDGAWGVQREELHAPYAEWLARHGILRDAAVWHAATTNDLLPTAPPRCSPA